MDLVSSCKDKLSHFRIKELKDVLTQLGLAKQGKKQDLVDRIFALLSDDQASKSNGWGKKYPIGKEGVAKVIDDTYRKMQVPGATDLASRSHGSPEFDNSNAPEDKLEPYQDTKVRCPCGSSLINGSLIKCEDSKCQVWQHVDCVIIPEKPMDGILPNNPQTFYCELCRISRADPFWVAIGHPLYPAKLTSSSVSAEGSTAAQTIERTFHLSRTDRELLQRAEYDLQVWCILLNDKVTFRMQWPQYSELLVNGIAVRTTNRPGSQLLGINGRDDAPLITTCSREGTNKITLSKSDARVFSFGIRIAKRRTLQQVLSSIPGESEGEHFEDALARVRRCISGGAAAENADSDSDLEVVADSVSVNLRCPMTGSRIKIAGRFKPCVHMGCFDLESFVELNQRSRKWQCPICLKNYSPENVIIDPYFNRITTLLKNCGEDVTEIDVKPDGSWRARNEAEQLELGLWHLSDSSLAVVPKVEVKPEPNIFDQINQGNSDGHKGLKLGIRRNRNGVWEVSKPEDAKALSSSSQFDEKYGTYGPKIIPMSSSASGSYRDGEDVSVNQDGDGHIDFSSNKSQEFESGHHSLDHAYNADDRRVGAAEANVIVLTDSEDDDEDLAPHNTVFNNEATDNNGIPFLTNPAPTLSYPEDPEIGTSTSCLGLFGDGDDFGIPPLWPLPECPLPANSEFQLLNTEAAVPDNFLVKRDSLDCSNGNSYGLAPGSLGNPEDMSSYRAGTDLNGGLVDNPLAFEDPSLQIFLPTRPSGAGATQANLNEHMPSNGPRTDDWISLRLGRAGMNLGDTSHASERDVRLGQHPSKETRAEPLDDAAALLISMNDRRPRKDISNSKRSESPFSIPRQPRSVRPRLYLSIDSDTD